ncbi:L-threonine 3-O-phosphate decarboxylase [Klebsiella oxytoca]|nr:L-threonine 3-O-phosphate decarboxylase [Klebsiella oxytoca]
MRRLSILSPMSRDLFRFWPTIRTCGCCVRSPNFMPLPGLRLGYLVNGDARAVARMRERQMPWSINAFAALAGEIILQDSAYQQKTWQWLAEEGQRFYHQLRHIPGLTVYPGTGQTICFCAATLRIWICNTRCCSSTY